MDSPDRPGDEPKLRMAPPETVEETARRIAREQKTSELSREKELGQSLGAFRVGSVEYLNAAPLNRGIEDEIVLATPSELAAMLRKNELDAALVSITEVLFNDRYDVLDSMAIASLGEVKSVLLAHRKPLEEAREIYCDPASLTSVELLRVLLAEKGVHPEFKLLKDYNFAELPDYALLIGDRALEFLFGPHDHDVWDLGTAWFELTSLPFVYAVWALRRDIENKPLRRALREARDFGLDTLDTIINTRTEYTHEFRKDYLGWHIHYHLGMDEKDGLDKFIELLRRHGTAPVYDPRFVF
jgi:chorismate dehydratase